MSSARFTHPRRRKIESSSSGRENTKLTPQEQSSSAYRLSKANSKYNQSKTIEQGLYKTYMEAYYKNHPNEQIDKRPVKEKFKDLQKQFQNTNLDENQRLNLLVQEKALNLIQFGENSHQSFLSFINIGICYNRLNKPTSAIRNLEKAHQLESVAKATKGEKELVAIETTEAHLVLFSDATRANKTDEANKQLKNAFNVIKPFMSTEIEELELEFRKSLAIAHIFNIKQMFVEAIPHFDSGVNAFFELYPDYSESHAQLAIEAAENAEFVRDTDNNAVHTKFYYYKLAYDIYKKLGMEEEAKEIEPKLPKEGEYTETEQSVPPTDSHYEEEEEFYEEETGKETTTEQYYDTETYQTQDYKSYQYKPPSNDEDDDKKNEEEEMMNENPQNESQERKLNDKEEEENQSKDDFEKDSLQENPKVEKEESQEDFEKESNQESPKVEKEYSKDDFENESNQGTPKAEKEESQEDFEKESNESNHETPQPSPQNKDEEEEDDFEDDFA